MLYLNVISLSESVKCDSELHHDLLMLHAVHLYVPSRVLMHIKRIHDAERQFIRLAFTSKSTRFLARYNLIGGLKLIQPKDEKFIEQLPY